MAAGMSCWPAATAGPQSVIGPSRSLFAKGLAKGCTSAHLHAIFSNFGVVTDCQIARHRSGRSAGFAIVTFLRHEEAVAAMQAVDNLMFMGRRLSVKWFSPERALEGNVGGVADVLNMQALQQALQLSAQLQPADLMTQLAQMLEPARPQAPQQQQQQQQQNPHVAAWLDNFMMSQHQESQLSARQQLLDPQLLNLSALSLAADLPRAAPMAPAAPCAGLDIPDGAVFVSATGPANATDKAAASDMGHSRLAKWCTAPGSATAASSVAPSLADDAGSETASVHASDDSSVATTATIQLAAAAAASTDGPRSSCGASSPATSTIASETAASASAGGSAPSAAPTRPGVLSDPGAPRAAPAIPGVPSLAPVRTSAMPQALQRPGAAQPMPQSATCFRPGPPNGGFGSCGGVASSAGASPTEAAALQQAMRLQHMLAEQYARNAQQQQQQQYVEALAKQVMAAASMLNGNPALAVQQHHHHQQQQLLFQQQQQQAHLLAGGHRAHPHAAAAAAMGANPYMQHPAGAQQPDLNTLLLLQNATALNRPLF